MEFRAHLPNLDNVGGTIRLHCLGWGPTPYALREEPGLLDVVWDTNRDDPAPEQAEIGRRDVVIAAAASEFVDSAGNLAFVYDGSTREEGGETVFNAPDHLRIYGHPRGPSPRETLANRPPVNFDWTKLKLQKDAPLPPAPSSTVPGDIPVKTYLYQGVPIAKREFGNWQYHVSDEEATWLEYDETAYWARNDGQWVAGATVQVVIAAADYNDWRTSARDRQYKHFQLWIPAILLALNEVATITAAEAAARNWLAANHAQVWQFYMSTGDKAGIEASLQADSTPWFNATIPEGVIPGLVGEMTAKQLIIGTLR